MRRAVAEERGVELQAHHGRHDQRRIRDGLATLALGDGRWWRTRPRLGQWAVRLTGRQLLRWRLRLGQPVAELEPGAGPIGGGIRHNKPSLTNERCWIQAMQRSSHREGTGASVRMDDVVAQSL
jgi:hypothetical protein